MSPRPPTATLMAIAKTVLLTALFAFLIARNPINFNPTHQQSLKFNEALICYSLASDCSQPDNFIQAQTPIFKQRQIGTGTHALTLRYPLDGLAQIDLENEIIGIFAPKFSDFIEMSVNGTPVSAFNEASSRRFDNRIHLKYRAFYTSFDKALLSGNGDILEVKLSGYPYEPLSMFQLYVGDSLTLSIRHTMRQFLRISLVEISIGFVFLISVLMIALWLSRRRDPQYLWIGIAGMSTLIPLVDHLVPTPLLPEHFWYRMTVSAAHFTAFSLWCYTRANFGFTTLRRPWASALIHMGMASAYWLSPLTFLGAATLLYQGFIGLFAIFITIHCAHKACPRGVDRRAHHALFCFLLAMGVLDAIYILIGPKYTAFQSAYLIPLVLMLGGTILVFRRLGQSLSRYEALNAQMEQTIEEKSSEIAEFEKQRALREERQRITFDLHDGVGGQLAGALAYLNSAGQSDQYLTDSLEAARRDIALIMDSLEEEQDLSGLLGAFRLRIEPLLERSNIELVWKVFENPVSELESHADALQIIRIVQEAVLNAIAHAQSTQIQISSEIGVLRIQDNGTGFDLMTKADRKGSNSGIGIQGMKSRAQKVGANFEIKSDESGTSVTLWWQGEAG